MNTLETLRVKAVKELLLVAKELEIVGRHEMKKEQLVQAIMEKEKFREFLDGAEDVYNKMMQPKREKLDKAVYIDNIKPGIVVAFKWSEEPGTKVISGKVIELQGELFVVQTKSGLRFTIKRDAITWVKTGERWPKPLYEDLKARGYA